MGEGLKPCSSILVNVASVTGLKTIEHQELCMCVHSLTVCIRSKVDLQSQKSAAKTVGDSSLAWLVSKGFLASSESLSCQASLAAHPYFARSLTHGQALMPAESGS